ncbi:GBF-interacting protein 1-like [Quillaja saponaria]|uniref:GBF-interacting protein 1-like n=1 Tax=Quillaja saponaria TaxID=32244 RepID=A0AAD7LMH0_QUISA|nr:GBF-interacting protein 1-like [Quillaja saponaria]KAJ7960667.1 GBF-interacting protein 1-like [Quillaja saponaria]
MLAMGNLVKLQITAIMGRFSLQFRLSTTYGVGKNANSQLTPISDSVSTDSGRQSIGADYSIFASVQPSLGNEPSWSGVSKEHLSKADIVRTGKPNKGSQTSTETSYASHDAGSHHRAINSLVSGPTQPELTWASGHQNHSGQCVFHDEWPVDEQPLANKMSLIANAFAASDSNVPSDHSNPHDSNLLGKHNSDAVHVPERSSENNKSDNLGSDFTSSSPTIMNNDGWASCCNNDLNNISSYDSQRCTYESHKGAGHDSLLSYSYHPDLTGNAVIDVSSAAGNFKQLSLRDFKLEVPPTEDNHTVVLPDHLHALVADCSHLSFGTYNSGSNLASVPPAPNLSKNVLDETAREIDSSSSGFLDASNSVYCGNEQLGSMNDTLGREITSDKNYDFLASPKSDILKQIIPKAPFGHEYFMSSVPDSTAGKIQWPAPALPFVREEFQSRNHITFPSEMLAGSDSVPADLLASKMKASRDSNFLQSASVKQPLPLRYSNSVSTFTSSTISMAEVAKPGTYSLPQQSSALTQHLTVQPTLSSEQPSISAVMGYHSLCQRQAYIPSVNLQQACSVTSAYIQSLEDMKFGLPLSRSEVSMNRLPLSAREASVYRNFGTPTYSPGNFLHSSIAPMIASSGYDDILRSQYRGGSNLSPLQQNHSFSVMDYGRGSRALPPVPESTYYSLLGQSQRHQRSQIQSNYGVPGYSNLHHSQNANAAEHQLQSGLQDLSSKQLHHLWQRSY